MLTLNYYNDNDKFCTRWLRALIAAKLIPPGDVDERDIRDVSPNDLRFYHQCHFFAGIGGWSYALRLADWPDDRPVWTGSCPCQPFSNAGKRKGKRDERHLWPAFRWLVAQCRPATVFGEQVASPLGRDWLSGVRSDLEAMGYEVGASDLCSAGVGAPNIRQRLWWVADSQSVRNYQFIKSYERKNATKPMRSIFFDKFIAVDFGDGSKRRIPDINLILPKHARIPSRMDLLRGAGNSINPWVAAEFIAAFVEAAKTP